MAHAVGAACCWTNRVREPPPDLLAFKRMHAHKLKVTVPETHQVVVRLPDDFPPGEAEVTVVSRAQNEVSSVDDFAWLKSWSASLPPAAPTIPLEALDRSELYR